MGDGTGTGMEYANQVAANELTAKLAAAEARERLSFSAARKATAVAQAAEARLAKATAVIEAGQDVVDEWQARGDGGCTIAIQLRLSEALANYHARPAETETPGEP